MSNWIIVTKHMLENIADVCEKNSYRECCGLITGLNVDDKLFFAEDVFNVDNIKKNESNIDYMMEPQTQFNILKNTTIIDKTANQDLVAIWHSHPLPFGEPIPSGIDVVMVSYNVVYIIFGLKSKTFKAWKFDKEKKMFSETMIKVM